jgi:hypothetical protein
MTYNKTPLISAQLFASRGNPWVSDKDQREMHSIHEPDTVDEQGRYFKGKATVVTENPEADWLNAPRSYRFGSLVVRKASESTQRQSRSLSDVKRATFLHNMNRKVFR